MILILKSLLLTDSQMAAKRSFNMITRQTHCWSKVVKDCSFCINKINIVQNRKTTIVALRFVTLIWLFLSLMACQSTLEPPAFLKVMSLNLYGWKTMPQHAKDYALQVKQQNVDILIVQEGVDDWRLSSSMPTDYSRVIALKDALGSCWQRHWQILVNQCQNIFIRSSTRFDLADGKNATRTGEVAEIATQKGKLVVINVHWDHESAVARKLSASQTATIANQYSNIPLLVGGDFNSSCQTVWSQLNQHTMMHHSVDGGIDCIFSRDATIRGYAITAFPSDHPAVIAEVTY